MICQQSKLYKNNSLLKQLKRIDKTNLNFATLKSHANYRFLTSEEKDKHMKLLHTQLRNKTHMLQFLKQNIKKNYQREAIVVDKGINDELAALLSAHASSIKDKYGGELFPVLYWQQQLSAASKKNVRSIRWHPLSSNGVSTYTTNHIVHIICYGTYEIPE